MRRTSTLLIGICVLALAATAYAGLSRSALGRGAALGGRDSRLLLSGHVGGLYPGARMRLRVRLRSRLPFAVKVRSIRARIGDAGSGCSRGNLRVRSYRGHMRIPPHGSKRAALRIEMSSGAPVACQGARFPVRFKARATR